MRIVRASPVQQVIAHYHQRNTGGPNIFLCACVDNSEAADIDWPRKYVARHVGNEWDITTRYEVKFDARNGLVRRVMQISRVLAALPVRLVRNVGKVPVRRICRNIDRTKLGSLICRFPAPATRDNVISSLIRRRKI